MASNKKKKILHIVGARPNFMKVAPLIRAMKKNGKFKQTLVHTGQHYDKNMSEIFFKELNLPKPDINLGVGSGTHAWQTANIMIKLEPVILKAKPEVVLVYGDVNSTISAALLCSKLGIKIGHVEAGLRSFDRTMPEEINRLLTDQLADILLIPSLDAKKNLLHEGICEKKIYFVGNVMIDTLINLLPKAREKWSDFNWLDKKLIGYNIRAKDLSRGQFGLVTIHRPSNVDDLGTLENIIKTLCEISIDLPLIFPIHPRTRKQLKKSKKISKNSRVWFMDPLGYLDCLALQVQAALVITDSGGIQEETTYLGIPCLTLRKNTERPITVKMGTNMIIGQDMRKLKKEVYSILKEKNKKRRVPPLWDGKAAERITKIIYNYE